MLANPWIPSAPKPVRRARHLEVGQLTSTRLFGILTSAFALVTATAVMQPTPTAAATLGPVSIDLAAPSTTGQPTSSTAPTSSTRPTLPEPGGTAGESEFLALAERPAIAAPAVTPIDSSTTTTTPAPETTVGEVDLAVFAVDLGDDSSRAVASEQALVVEPIPDDPWECYDRASQMPLLDASGSWDRNLIAQMTHTVFECVSSVAGFADVGPTSGGWDAAGTWGFESLAGQVAAEAVVVGYCESVGFSSSAMTSNNPWGYGGVFQMGATEMRLYGFAGASKFDPVDNVYSAATYFVAMNRRGGGWGGWGPWAVVNTGYNDEVNDRVKVPVLPRFTSTDPDYRGRRGAELPAWAVDPWSYVVPAFGGCPTTGGQWPLAEQLVADRS